MCLYVGRHEEFKDLFCQEGCVVFCNDVCSVMKVLGHECSRDQCSLLTDSSRVSLKVVLVRNGNRFSSFPFVHAANMKEIYERVKLRLGKFKMKNIIGTHKVISRL